MNRPNQRILLLFPGQGSQYLGMGQDLYQAYDCVRQTYHEASDILGYDMAALSFEDPQQHIHLTRYTQPALPAGIPGPPGQPDLGRSVRRTQFG